MLDGWAMWEGQMPSGGQTRARSVSMGEERAALREDAGGGLEWVVGPGLIGP